MRFMEASPHTARVSGLSCQQEDDRFTLRWHWPSEIDAVYIGRSAVDGGPEGGSLRLYTKAEYKANNGYPGRMEGIGRYIYTVYAYQEDEEGPLLISQADRENELAVSSGKARIQYEIQQKSGWFRSSKTIQIQVMTEVPIGKDVLCYVKSRAAILRVKRTGCCIRSSRILRREERCCRRSRLANRILYACFSQTGKSTDNCTNWLQCETWAVVNGGKNDGNYGLV